MSFHKETVGQQPNSGIVHFTVEISRSHTHTHKQPAWLLWTNDQLVAEAAT